MKDRRVEASEPVVLFHIGSNVVSPYMKVRMGRLCCISPTCTQPDAQIRIRLQGPEIAALEGPCVPRTRAILMACTLAEDPDAVIRLPLPSVPLSEDTLSFQEE